MKKLMVSLFILAFLAMACSSPTGGEPGTNPVPVTSVTVTPSIELNLGMGATITLHAGVSPEDATDKTITWHSRNTTVATVDAEGKVTGVAAGTTIIEAIPIGDAAPGTSQITVVASTASVTGVVVIPPLLSLFVGKSSQLSASVEPGHVSDRSVTWTSSNPSIATVDAEGKVTGVAAGDATITAKSILDLDSSKTGVCVITVSELDPEDVLISSITLNKTSLSLAPTAQEPLTATVLPLNATTPTLTWASDKPAVAEVGQNGEVTAKAVGTAVISAIAQDGSGLLASCTVTVKIAVSGVSLESDTLSLTVGSQPYQLTATITPSDATNKALTWGSDKPAVAEVGQDGKVTAKAKGTAEITVTTADGGHIDTCAVTVPDPAVHQKLDQGKYQLVNGQYDAAIDSFEAAFNADSPGSDTYVESVVYSSLGKLSSIPKEQKFRELVAGRLGIVGYPDTLDSLFTDDWFAEYAEKIDYFYPGPTYTSWYNWVEYGWFAEFTTPGWYLIDSSGYPFQITLQSADFNWPVTQGMVGVEPAPGFNPPSWLPQGDNSYYKDNLVNMGDKTLKSIVLLEYLFFANLLDKNTSGLNNLLDDVAGAVFGATFKSVDDRINTLDYGAHATLDAGVIAAFGLDELFEGDDIHIGKAELKVLISSLKLIKGSLEWLRAYDWDTQLNYFKGDFESDTYARDLFDKIKALNISEFPLQNNFLKARGGASTYMDRAKADYLGAVTDLIAAWDSIDQSGDIPQAVRDMLNDYNWIKDGLGTLKTAIDTGMVFYVPEELPEGALTWPAVDPDNAAFGVNFGKFFTTGYLGIDKLIENSGNTPKFYRASGNDSYTPIPVFSKSDADSFFEDIFNDEDDVAIKIQYGNFKDLFPGLFDDGQDESEYLSFGAELGALLYYRYNDLSFDFGE